MNLTDILDRIKKLAYDFDVKIVMISFPSGKEYTIDREGNICDY